MIATIRPFSTWPAAERATPTARAITKETAKPMPASRSGRPRSALEVDLQTGEEEQEGQPEEGEDADHGVGLDPPEDGRADDDPRDDLEDHRGKPQTRQEADRQRGEQRHRGDGQESGEREILHEPPCFWIRE